MKKILYLLCMLTLVLSSCSSKKKLIGSLTGPNPEQARFEAVVANNYKYDALQSKVKLSMGKSGLNGKMCIESGKRFCLSVNAPLLGFEVARIEATADSVILVDKMDKVYSVVTLADLTKVEAINGHEMEALECLMLGRIFIPGKGQATSKDYERLSWSTPLVPGDDVPNSVGIYNGGNYTLAYSINSAGQLESTSLTTQDGNNAVWKYGTHEIIDKKNVANSEQITAISKDNKELKAGLTLSNPSFGDSTWRDFEATSSYRRVSLSELGNIIKEMIK